EQNEEALAAFQQIAAALSTTGGQAPVTPPPPTAAMMPPPSPASAPQRTMPGRLGRVLLVIVTGAIAFFLAQYLVRYAMGQAVARPGLTGQVRQNFVSNYNRTCLQSSERKQ